MDGENKLTRGAKDLLGEPKKAVRKIGTPMMIGMLVHSIYNIVDGFWVAGLGADELAAVGLFFPFFMVIIALGAGIGVGGSSAISRKVGKKDRERASNIASHTVLSGILISLCISLPLVPFTGFIFNSLSGNGNVGALASIYSKILFSGAFLIVFSNIANGILRGEGAAKKAMYGMVLGSVLNAFLDPFFIYTLDLGIAGAAVSTVTSLSVSGSLFVYWLFFQGETYVQIKLRDFDFDWSSIQEIFGVGIPSSLAQISMSVTLFILNAIIITTGTTDGVAVFTSGWRIIMLGLIPLVGLGAGVTAVTGAAFGQENREKLNIAYMYSIKIGILIEGLVAVCVFFFAPQFAGIFTYSEEASRIFPELVRFLKISSLFFPAVPLGMFTAALFRGVRMGVRSMVAVLIRNIFFLVPLAYLFGIVLNYGLVGVWIGLILGNFAGAVVAFVWGRITVKNIFSPTPSKLASLLPR